MSECVNKDLVLLVSMDTILVLVITVCLCYCSLTLFQSLAIPCTPPLPDAHLGTLMTVCVAYSGLVVKLTLVSFSAQLERQLLTSPAPPCSSHSCSFCACLLFLRPDHDMCLGSMVCTDCHPPNMISSTHVGGQCTYSTLRKLA